MIRTIVGASLLVFAACGVFAQTAEKRLSFEVATVRLAPPDSKDNYQNGYRAGMASRGLVIEGKRATVTNNTLRDLVRLAYEVNDHQVSAAPWLASQRFDVAAMLPDGADRSQAPEMLRALLEERFHLECHWEPKEMPVLALIVAKGGFKPATVTGGTWTMIGGPGTGGVRAAVAGGVRVIRMKAATMAAFADRLTGLTDRPVQDMTELAGTYDFNVTFTLGDGDSAPSLYTALQEQQGLKLEARKATVKTVVVDRADKLPTEN